MLNGLDPVPLFVEHVVAHFNRQLGNHPGGALLARFLTDYAKHGQGKRLHASHMPDAIAAAAYELRRLFERRSQPLPRHLKKPEFRDPADLDAGPVPFDHLPQPAFHLPLMLVGAHVDEIDHDQAAQIADPELARDFLGGLEVGVQRSGLNIVPLGRASRVDIDRGERLGVIDDDASTGGQRHGMCERRFNLAFDLKASEQRNRRVVVILEPAQVVRHYLLHELASLLVDVLPVH